MKSNILSIAIVAAATSVISIQASASVMDVYGEIGFGVESISGVDDMSLTSQGGKLGITDQAESTEDYTFGYQFEVALSTTGSVDTVSVSQANLTVGTTMGDLTIGRQGDAVGELTTDLSDVFAAPTSSVFVNDAMSLEVEAGDLSIVVSGVMDNTSDDMFDTMSFGGSIEVVESINLAGYLKTDKDSVASDITTTSFGGGYTAGDLYVSAAWLNVDDGTTKVSNRTFAGSYSIDEMTISGSMNSTDASDAASTRLGAAYGFGANAVAYVDYSMANTAAEALGQADTFMTGVRLKF